MPLTLKNKEIHVNFWFFNPTEEKSTIQMKKITEKILVILNQMPVLA